MEHLHHFGLSQDPFSNEPDLRFYFEAAGHAQAQLRVERGLRQRKGLTVLTGAGGMGKTLLTRRILESLEEEVFEATLLVMLPGAADASGILQRFARQLGCEEPATDRAALLGQLYEHLAIVREDGRHAVLMVDDAHIMTPEVFSELTGLLNLEYEDRRLLSMLMVGSPDLDRMVENDPSVAPRVDVRVCLQPFDMPNAIAYLNHRMTAVGGNTDIIPPACMDALFKFGRGRPRLLNTLADNGLFEAYLSGRAHVDATDIERAAADLGIGPDPGMTYTAATPTPVSPAASLPFSPAVATPGIDSEPAADLAPLAPVAPAPEPALEALPSPTPEPTLEAVPSPTPEPALEAVPSPAPEPAAEIPSPFGEAAADALDSELSFDPVLGDDFGEETPAAPALLLVPELESAPETPAEPIVQALPALELDEPVSEFEFAPAEEAAPAASEAGSATLDLDEGLEAAMGEFEFDAPAGSSETSAGILEFDVEPGSAEPKPAPLIADTAPELLLDAEELAPLDTGDASELDDAFVELLDE